MAASAGNAFEYFDLTLYTFFAVVIGQVMFPAQDPGAQILLSLGVFGVGYCARPIGAVFFGNYADSRGRKAAVNLSLLLMATGTGLIGIAPTYAQVGLLAPIIVLAGRLLQGFSSGGETGALTTLLVESAPSNRRGFYASWALATQGIATMFGSGAAWIASASLTPEQLNAWGWRIPFFLGIMIVPIARYLRRTLEETLDEVTAAQSKQRAPITVMAANYKKTAILALLGAAGGNVTYVIFNLYMPTYAIHELGLPVSVSVGAGLCAAITTAVLAPLGGYLSDIFGRKPPQIIARILIIVLAYPAFMLISAKPSTLVLLATVTGMSFLLAMISGYYAHMAESFPKSVRASGFATMYALSTVLIGGFSQMIITALIQWTGNKTIPASYLVIVGLLSLIGVIFLRPHQPEPGDVLVHADAPGTAVLRPASLPEA
ncbi:MFS transporter [Bradyrhizobium commune]|nr:MFS transporter [Bradyrhizobium commune]